MRQENKGTRRKQKEFPSTQTGIFIHIRSMLISVFPLPGGLVFDWLGELVETQVIWPHISSWLQPDAQSISAAPSWHRDACYTELHSPSPLHYKSCIFLHHIYSKIYRATLHIPVALTIFQVLRPWNLQVSGLSYGYLLNPEPALLF